ncbi:MAG TPA: hypothetical protein PK325_05525 [Cyclobacteriaceae bacterium]|nr:hypothetical protein [Cyclobacteriaceae bacterium]HMV08678.1 hypothetical protein [Cyclobacteriaceae bacterium]HMV91729.1 hypothetical protein [Cyclobacteriaceae bacterium]HMX00113.1 hypothetical protein [Cyclobacteriaceae bacterium]HMX49025.1 hypothetical protein [Cyclobacteriaceae bacterium]
MKKKLFFYVLVAALVLIDALLLSSPNLLGKMGLVIYKYFYLKNFPRTLVTVTILVLAAVLISEFVALLVRNKRLKRSFGIILLTALVILSAFILYQTVMSFQAWTYAHTGQRFRYGAYLLPCIFIFIFANKIFNLPVAVEEEGPVDNKPI